MMDIPATSSTPRVRFIEEKSVLEFVGESYPENSFAFFAPVFEWLNVELPHKEGLRVEVNIAYMNSSSTKCMLDILDALTESAEEGRKISVTWFYEAGNDRALDLAEEFKEDISLPFEIVPRETGKR
ncbi:MAG: DUF1987 domain-containing protein [Treponemataceae bacterium]